jgi:hypothetical protein
MGFALHYYRYYSTPGNNILLAMERTTHVTMRLVSVHDTTPAHHHGIEVHIIYYIAIA